MDRELVLTDPLAGAGLVDEPLSQRRALPVGHHPPDDIPTDPSRRSNAPTAPGVLQASASRTIFRLYSTVNRRRVAFATTSITCPPWVCSNALITLQS